MPFFSLNNTDIEFIEVKRLTWKTYTIAETILTTQKIKLIGKHNFVKAALDGNSETFVVHVTILEASEITIYLSQIAQIAALQ